LIEHPTVVADQGAGLVKGWAVMGLMHPPEVGHLLRPLALCGERCSRQARAAIAQGHSVFRKGLPIKLKTSERVLVHVGLCLTGTPPMTQNPFIKVSVHDSTTPSPHRGLLRHRGLS
jgi:hypothetical protein